MPMWHEARRQEKEIRHRMVDSRRRAERRKKFYDTVKKDPSEFMQVSFVFSASVWRFHRSMEAYFSSSVSMVDQDVVVDDVDSILGAFSWLNTLLPVPRCMGRRVRSTRSRVCGRRRRRRGRSVRGRPIRTSSSTASTLAASSTSSPKHRRRPPPDSPMTISRSGFVQMAVCSATIR